jgi:SAM-dependent MidA family methyltransferase
MHEEYKPELVQDISSQIASAGGLPFADFMAQALYHPTYGYYTAPRTRIGKQGDFFTSSSVHPCFGRLVARQLVQMWDLLGRNLFVIAEQGAGEGHLCLDILDAIAEEAPELYAVLTYRIVEISADNRQRQAEMLIRHVEEGRVDWCDFADLKGMEGCFLSNELVDAFPVHLIEKHGGELQEVYVVKSEEGFTEELRTPSNGEIQKYFDLAGIEPIEGNRCEVNLHAGIWMRQVAEIIKRGFVLTIDYGYTAEDLYTPSRHAGTFLCYHKHQTNDEPYNRVGCQDMTAHVDFSRLQLIGQQRGLNSLYFGQQYQFLMALGFIELLIEMESRETDPKKAQAIRMSLKTLILPDGGMGESFKVLIQAKNIGTPELLCQKKIKDIRLPGGIF